ncbi:MAG: ATP-binding protein [Halothiobacillaceae bacterium]
MNRFKALLRTTAMRQALGGALLQVGVLALALLVVFVLMQQRIDDLVKDGLEREMHELAALPLASLQQNLAHEAVGEDGLGVRHALLLDAQGQTLAGNILQWPAHLEDGQVRAGRLVIQDDDSDHEDVPHATLMAKTLAHGERLILAHEPGVLESLRDVLLGAVVLTLLLSALVSLGLGARLGLRWLSRVEDINTTAGKIARGELSARLPQSPHGDEFDLLAGHLNAMLARVEQAVLGMREVSDHVAHDLRKPLSRLKNQLEAAALRLDDAPHDRQTLQQSIAQAAAEADELIHAFDAMLSIARLDAGSELVVRESFDVAEALSPMLELYQDQAEDEGRVLNVSMAAGLLLRGSAPLLARAWANVLDNALLYTPQGSPIEVEARRLGERIVLECIDHGAGIAVDERERMLQKFTRGDKARTLAGSGLGLPLARAVARAHEGELGLHATPGGGLTVRMVFVKPQA